METPLSLRVFVFTTLTLAGWLWSCQPKLRRDQNVSSSVVRGECQLHDSAWIEQPPEDACGVGTAFLSDVRGKEDAFAVAADVLYSPGVAVVGESERVDRNITVALEKPL